MSDERRVHEETAGLVLAELRRATERFGPMASAHEGWAVIQEEVDELWQEVKSVQSNDRMGEEAVQIAAMAMRFVIDVSGPPSFLSNPEQAPSPAEEVVAP